MDHRECEMLLVLKAILLTIRGTILWLCHLYFEEKSLQKCDKGHASAKGFSACAWHFQDGA